MWRLLLLLPYFCAFSSELTVAIQEHNGYSARDGKGYLNELIREFDKNGVNAKFVHLPLRRALTDYYGLKKYDCMIGGDEDLLRFHGNNPDDKYFSDPHLVFKTRIFSKKKAYCDVNDLSGESIIVINRFPYKKTFEGVKLSRVEIAPSLDQAIKMAKAGRADALIGYVPTPNQELEEFKFCEELTLTKNFSKTHCYKSPESLELINKINKALKSLKKSGKLYEFLETSYGEKLAKEIYSEI